MLRGGPAWGLAGLLWLGACRGEVDPCAGARAEVFFADEDGDGFGDTARYAFVCPAERPAGWVELPGDCDDARPEVYPGAPERCDGLDNDCDRIVDGGLPRFDVYVDADGDGWGRAPAVSVCARPEGVVDRAGDCDDTDASVNPEAVEVCNGVDDDCDGWIDEEDPDLDLSSGAVWYLDGDGDGFGDPETAFVSCLPPPGAVADGSDCDDLRAAVHPGSPEVCNGLDDDCNGLVDDADPGLLANTRSVWHTDADGDGLGDPATWHLACASPGSVLNGLDCDDTDARVGGIWNTRWAFDGDGDGVGAGPPSELGCTPPGPDWVVVIELGEDCDDADPAVSPVAEERCNGIDDDCDGLVDDEDPSLSLASAVAWLPDLDVDGFGGPIVVTCLPPGPIAAVGGDCDDADPDVNPAVLEVCNGLDDDCDGLVDDADPDVDLTTSPWFWQDADGDGFGDPSVSARFCSAPSGWVDNGDDCDDAEPRLGPPALWWADADGDGFGAGDTRGPACAPPLPGDVLVASGLDCADADPTAYPGAPEQCEDGVDQSCDGADAPCARETCLHWLQDGLSHGDGVYAIAPNGRGPFDVWCDMTADGGGWTLVSSTNDPVDDQATGWSPELTTLDPAGPMDGLWDGLRDVVDPYGDIRFACSLDPSAPGMRVDLVFYAIHWYVELTSGPDEAVCFSETDGLGQDLPPPRRKNLLTGAVRARGNPWNAGYLEGEDLCDSRDDFTVDFDDRGMDSNQSDGTDWGEDDDVVKCGVNGAGAAWYIFVR